MIYSIISERGPFTKYNIGYPYFEISINKSDIFRKKDMKKMPNRFYLRVITKDNDGIMLPEDKYKYDVLSNYIIVRKGVSYDLGEFCERFM